MSIHTGKYVTEDKSRIDITKLMRTQKKQKKTQNAAMVWFSRLLRHAFGQKTRWAYSTTLPSPQEVVIM